MANGTSVNKDNADKLVPPSTLSTEERWIVRIHGRDLGPFSSKDLYPKLLTGEIEPESLLLDQNSFTRYRLKDVDEFKPYLHLHNTQNPILLKEQKQQERDTYWQEKGKKQVIIGISSFFAVAILGVIIWRVFFYQSGDVALYDGDYKFNVGEFKGLGKKHRMKTVWEDDLPRRGRRRRGKKNSKNSNVAAAVDFSQGGGSMIPRKKILRVIRRNIRSIFPCFKRRMEQESRFSGGNIRFAILGTGRIGSIGVEGTDYSSMSLVRCIKRKAKRWTFPTFPGSAVVYYPIYIQRRSRY